MAARKSKTKAARAAARIAPVKKAAQAKSASVKKPVRPAASQKTKSKPAKAVGREKAPVASQEKLGLSKQDRERLKQILLGIKERLIGQVASLKVDALTREDGVNSAEDGTDAFDRQFALSIASSENHDLVEIDEALRRLEDGSYGSCEECGCAIVSPRLKALPFVRRCVGCQSKTENGRRHIRVSEMPDQT